MLEKDPFVELDREGVGELMRLGIERGRAVKPDLKLGICGEHGGDPPSIAFGHEVGLDYVSCSPYRVLTPALPRPRPHWPGEAEPDAEGAMGGPSPCAPPHRAG